MTFNKLQVENASTSPNILPYNNSLFENPELYSSDSYPNMEDVLSNFGIDISTLIEVPLDKYYWNEFSSSKPKQISLDVPLENDIATCLSLKETTHLPKAIGSCKQRRVDHDDNILNNNTDTQSISQRIRTLRRDTKSRYKTHKPSA